MKRAALILAALAAILTAAAAPVRTATENFVTNKIAEAVAAIPSPDLSPFLRKDLGQSGFQEFGGMLSGMGFNVTHETSNFNGWYNYTAKNGSSNPFQSLPDYIQSNPWGFQKRGDVTAAIREQSLGGIWDETLQVWWTPRMRNGSLTYEATTNVNLNAEN